MVVWNVLRVSLKCVSIACEMVIKICQKKRPACPSRFACNTWSKLWPRSPRNDQHGILSLRLDHNLFLDVRRRRLWLKSTPRNVHQFLRRLNWSQVANCWHLLLLKWSADRCVQLYLYYQTFVKTLLNQSTWKFCNVQVSLEKSTIIPQFMFCIILHFRVDFITARLRSSITQFLFTFWVNIKCGSLLRHHSLCGYQTSGLGWPQCTQWKITTCH